MEMDLGALLGEILPETTLLLGAVAVLVFAVTAPRRWQAGAAGIAAVAVLVAAGLTWHRLRADEPVLIFTDSYALDGLTNWGALFVLVTTLGVICLSVHWFRSDPRHGEYYLLVLLSALGLVLLCGANDLIQLVLALLLSSVTGYVLSAYHRRSRQAAEAGMKYFLMGALSNTSMLFGVALLFGLVGVTTYPLLGEAFGPPSGGLIVGFALLLLALMFKLGAVPVHAWVPDVSQGAPAPVAAFVTAAPKVGGMIAVARLVAIVPVESVGWRPLLAVLAAVTMTVGNLTALWQEDLRRMLGWSSVSQTGNGMLALVALGRSDLALPALLFYLASYVLGSVAVFGVVVSLRGRTRREDYRGMARHRPLLAALLVLGFLSFIGIPPLAGFAAKLLLFTAAIEAGYAWLTVLAVLNAVLSVVYYTRFVAPMYFESGSGRFPLLSPLASATTVVTGASVLVVGLAAGPLITWFSAAVMLSP